MQDGGGCRWGSPVTARARKPRRQGGGGLANHRSLLSGSRTVSEPRPSMGEDGRPSPLLTTVLAWYPGGLRTLPPEPLLEGVLPIFDWSYTPSTHTIPLPPYPYPHHTPLHTPRHPHSPCIAGRQDRGRPAQAQVRRAFRPQLRRLRRTSVGPCVQLAGCRRLLGGREGTPADAPSRLRSPSHAGLGSRGRSHHEELGLRQPHGRP